MTDLAPSQDLTPKERFRALKRWLVLPVSWLGSGFVLSLLLTIERYESADATLLAVILLALVAVPMVGAVQVKQGRLVDLAQALISGWWFSLGCALAALFWGGSAGWYLAWYGVCLGAWGASFSLFLTLTGLSVAWRCALVGGLHLWALSSPLWANGLIQSWQGSTEGIKGVLVFLNSGIGCWFHMHDEHLLRLKNLYESTLLTDSIGPYSSGLDWLLMGLMLVCATYVVKVFRAQLEALRTLRLKSA